MAQASLEDLEKRNKFLEDELQTLRDLFQNLNAEKDLESPDQRRAFMLKAQNYQLERQCMLLAQAQSNRASVLTEIECQLQNIISAFKSIISEERPSPNVIVKRSQLMGYLDSLSKLKHSLCRQSQLESSDSLRIPSLMTGSKFNKSQKAINCLDVFKMRTENLNMRYISDLEQDLSSLRKRLLTLNIQLRSGTFDQQFDVADVGKCLISPWMKKMNLESEKCVSDLEHCSDKLLSLSLLHPSAPWSSVKNSDEFEAFNFDDTIKSFPASFRKNSAVRSAVKEICQAHKYTIQKQRQKLDVMEQHLDHQRRAAKIQSHYLMRFSSLLLINYEAWKGEVVDTIHQPVSKLLRSWNGLKGDQSGTKLKQFFNDFKMNESQLEKLPSMVSSESPNSLFASLDEHLMKSLNEVTKEYEAEIHKIESALDDEQ